MGLSYSVDDDLNLVTITGEYADAPEWERVLERILTEGRSRPGCVILRDQRGGTRPVDAATVIAIMDVVRRYWDKIGVRRAAVVMPTNFDPPALIAQALAEDHDMPIRAFQSADDAVDWLTDPAGAEPRAT